MDVEKYTGKTTVAMRIQTPKCYEQPENWTNTDCDNPLHFSLELGSSGEDLPAVLWKRACSQYKQATNHEDLPIPMENPYKEPLKKCILCEKHVDYKNVQLLFQFISPFTGCIYGRHIIGLCGKKQKEITKAIKRSQKLGFMSVTYKDPAYLKDPKVCNIRYRE
ncbi:PREDICTED: 28S ribosomal protein S18c, mitochondrial-like [Elephantulus edwardii]|uniref:28S ribosomal protein S18c, mitochondrial-like n=1 Tax=Elephantulus edwardii TaxID=28737 RepID=UPI0003F0A9B4|nr:PREDICTED: 28S ribosomal protein S18c, mitochondrial-like [Elephantulus edwardii]